MVFEPQLRALADAGYRAIALDMLGYGGTDAPRELEAYAYASVTEWLVAVLDALDLPEAVFVGHDFGASCVWNVALRAPERCRALVLLSVPYDPDRSPTRPSALYAAMAEKHFLHIHYFQAEGVAEAELDAKPREFLARLFFALSGDYRYLEVWRHPSRGNGYLDVLPAAPRSTWLDDGLLDRLAAEFTRTGFRGGLSWYRAFDVNWERGVDVIGRRIEVPTLFVAGDRDPVILMRGEKAIERMRGFIPDLRGVHLLPGAGHFLQLERKDDVSRLLLEFLAGL